MLNPKLALKLMSEVSEMKEFVKFVQIEAFKLDLLPDNEATDDPVALSINVKARKKAKEVLKSILGPLVNTDDNPLDNDPSEFVV